MKYILTSASVLATGAIVWYLSANDLVFAIWSSVAACVLTLDVLLFGLTLAERLGQCHCRLVKMLMPSVQSLLVDEVEKIRAFAREIADDFAKGRSLNRS